MDPPPPVFFISPLKSNTNLGQSFLARSLWAGGLGPSGGGLQDLQNLDVWLPISFWLLLDYYHIGARRERGEGRTGASPWWFYPGASVILQEKRPYKHPVLHEGKIMVVKKKNTKIILTSILGIRSGKKVGPYEGARITFLGSTTLWGQFRLSPCPMLRTLWLMGLGVGHGGVTSTGGGGGPGLLRLRERRDLGRGAGTSSPRSTSIICKSKSKWSISHHHPHPSAPYKTHLCLKKTICALLFPSPPLCAL